MYFVGCKFTDIAEFQSMKRSSRSSSGSNNSENLKSITEKKSVINGETPVPSDTVTSRTARLQRRQAQRANKVPMQYIAPSDIFKLSVLLFLRSYWKPLHRTCPDRIYWTSCKVTRAAVRAISVTIRSVMLLNKISYLTIVTKVENWVSWTTI